MSFRLRSVYGSAPWKHPVWLVMAAAVLLLVGCGENSSETDVLELQIGTVTAPGSLVSASAEEFARRINERLEGRVRVVFFGSSQLGNDEVLVQKLKLGTLDFAVPSTIMSSLVEEFGLFEMPYLVRDRDHMRRIGEEIFWPTLAPAAEAKGYRVLGLWENGFRAHHQQHAPHLHAGGSRRYQAANAAGRVAVQAVPGVRCEPDADAAVGGVRRPTDRCHRRPRRIRSRSWQASGSTRCRSICP